VEQLAELLVAADPAAATDTLLRFVCQRHAAAGGLVIALKGRERIVRAVSSLDLGHVGAVQKAWNAHEATLRSGRRVVAGTHAIFPLMEAGDLAGALVLDEAKQLEPERLGPFLVALAKAVTAAAVPVRPRMDHGALLQRTLDENAWNVARVARTLGVTRRTIYMRMQRFGIPRRRVPKIIKQQ
ncbi:MAG TPA: helix-turn-helix domain-containing protein, partial [Vicinamibacteria bacterium]|nr:helix-turn-helix domain-containing protein [Vicinamibacteria bacterium]